MRDLFRLRELLRAAFCLLCFCSDSTFASVKLTLYYNDRPPYLEAQNDGRVTGLTATPAVTALERAGIPFQWKKASAEQQLAVINRNTEAACLVGWFKRPERQLIGKFSAPLYAGKRMVALSLARNQRFTERMRILDLMKDPQLTMLAKSGYSYGHIIDEQIKNYAPQQVFATGENINMMQMLRHERADYFLLSEEEAKALIARSENHANEFRISYFAEGIKEDTRHFWCTRQMPDHLLQKLNAVLQKDVARRAGKWMRHR